VNWSNFFDEAHLYPGATEAVIEQFIAEVSRPMSLAEIQEANAVQKNPFREGDKHYSSWKPFDAAAWIIPNRPLPESYLSLLRWSDGGEFQAGRRLIQIFPTVDPKCGVRAMMLAYQLPEYMPGALPIGFDGCGTFYLFDMREPAVDWEYPVLTAHSGYLGWEPDAYSKLADTLIDACRMDIE
jgi:hypothetical protein